MTDTLDDLKAKLNGVSAICSNRPRPSVQTGAKGHQWWRGDLFHLTKDKQRTLCGINCSDWLPMGDRVGEDFNISHNTCTRCAKKVGIEIEPPEAD